MALEEGVGILRAQGLPTRRLPGIAPTRGSVRPRLPAAHPACGSSYPWTTSPGAVGIPEARSVECQTGPRAYGLVSLPRMLGLLVRCRARTTGGSHPLYNFWYQYLISHYSEQEGMRPGCLVNSIRSYWIPGSYAPALSEKRHTFLRLLKNKGFKEESRTKTSLYALGIATPLESNKSPPRNPMESGKF